MDFPHSDGPSLTKYALPIALGFALLGVLLRLIYALSLPLLENDATVLFQAARESLRGGGLSMVQTLPALILAALFALTGESLFVSTLPNLLADMGTITLCYLIGRDIGGRLSGAVAAMLYAATPLALLYSPITKPYALLSFLSLLGVWLWARSLTGGGWRRLLTGGAAGLSFAGAFACHTFAAHAAFPLAAAVLVGLTRKHRRLLAPSLCASLCFGAVLAPLLAWRFPVFGWSIFNDYTVDWRFEIATLVWSVRWEGLTSLFALAPFALAPGLAFFLLDKRRGTGPVVGYLSALIVLDLLIYLLNPVNHFPRVLLPSAAPLAILAGLGLCGVRRGSKALWVGAGIACVGMIWLGIEISLARPFGIGMIHDVSAGKFLFLVIALAVVAVGTRSFLSRNSAGEGGLAGAVFALGLAVFCYGLLHSHAALDRQVFIFQGRLKALKACDSGSGVLGGGDISHLFLPGPHNYSWLTDLPDTTLARVFRSGLLDALREAQVGCVVVAWEDPQGEQAMLAAFAKGRGLPHQEGRNLFQVLEDNPKVRDLYADSRFSAYALPWRLPTKHDFEGRHALYSPVWNPGIWSIP